jgi:hypothetical protein
MAMTGIYEAGIEQAIIGQKQQALAVLIQPPHRINIWYRNMIFEGGARACVCELGENPVGLEEEEIAHDARMHG